MNSKPDPKWPKVLGVVLLLVPTLLIGWLMPGLFDLSAGSSERRKPLSAEAKFFRLVFGVLLVVGVVSWLLWRKFTV
jgi:hypothetical protein